MLFRSSEGMLETAKATISGFSNVQHMVIDIQDIPFENDSFDVVIANMMLYHVPDLEKGLSEVRRVLKVGGTFYCATYGEHKIPQSPPAISRTLCFLFSFFSHSSNVSFWDS